MHFSRRESYSENANNALTFNKIRTKCRRRKSIGGSLDGAGVIVDAGLRAAVELVAALRLLRLLWLTPTPAADRLPARAAAAPATTQHLHYAAGVRGTLLQSYSVFATS